MKPVINSEIDSEIFEQATSKRSALRIKRANQTIKWTWFLSLASSFPFIVLSALLILLNDRNPFNQVCIDLLKTYGAVVLSFIGGIRWGNAMRFYSNETGRIDIYWSIAPALLGWLSLLLSTPYVFAIQILIFAGLGAWDSFAGQSRLLPDWFVKLRVVLTFVVCAVLLGAFFATT